MNNIIGSIIFALGKINFLHILIKAFGNKVVLNTEHQIVTDNHFHTVSTDHIVDLKKFIDDTPDWALLEFDCKGECQYV